jgi:hypothetical protein
MKTNQPNVTNVQTSLFCNNSYQRTSFNYNGASVEFRLTENVMLNATQMARPFGKRPKEWLRLLSTKEFLFALQQSKGLICPLDSKATEINSTYHSYYGGLVIGQHGGANPGTWMHEDVAIEFARWLNPKFAIWCNDRIKEILRNGNMALPTAKPAKVLTQDTKTSIVSEIKKRIAQSHEEINRFTAACSSNVDDVKYGADIENFYWSEKLTEKENTQKLLDVLDNNTKMAISLLYQNRQLLRSTYLTSQQRTISMLAETNCSLVNMLYSQSK